MTTTTTKYTITPKNEKEAARIATYLKRGKFNFSVRGNAGPKKNPALAELEQTFAKAAGTKRFRFSKVEKAEVEAGNATREAIIRKRIRGLEKIAE